MPFFRHSDKAPSACHSEERSDEESPETQGILRFAQDDGSLRVN